MATFTLFGATGFVGRHLSERLAARGHTVGAIARGALPAKDTALGHVVYCVGLTADFRTRPNATAEAHVGLLADVFERARFDSFLYLSSTRVYAGAADGREETPLTVRPAWPDHLYNLTKLAGEALTLSQPSAAARVARLSNVLGLGSEPSNFVPSVIDEAARTGRVTLRTAPASVKDYVDIADVCDMIERIALGGTARLYNLGSGTQTTHAEVADAVRRQLNATVNFAADAPVSDFPSIDVGRLREEFSYAPRPFTRSFSDLVAGMAIKETSQ